MTEYIIRAGTETRCKTDWRPVAIAAWHRATTDWNAARDGDDIELLIDGECVSRVHAPKTGQNYPWPVAEDSEPDIRDIAAAVLQLCRAAGVSAGDLSDSMTSLGLPTTRSRLKSISTIEPGRQSNASEAEIVAMCYAGVGKIKSMSSPNDPR